MSRSSRHWLQINRAPVLTLWAAVVAERLGFKRDEALTLGRSVAGLNAYSKGKSLGLFSPTPAKLRRERDKLRPKDTVQVELMQRAVPAVQTEDGLRALSKNKPIDPAGVERYLEGKFGGALQDARGAMRALARAHTPSELARRAYGMYADFRPDIPGGKKGWGAEGRLSLDRIRDLAREAAD